MGPLLRIAACALLFDALVPLAPFLAAQTGRSNRAVQAAIATGIAGFAVAQLSAAPLLRRTGLRSGMLASSAFIVALGSIVACLPRSTVTLPLLVAMFVANAPGSVAARAMLRTDLDHASYQRVIARLYASLECIEIVLPFAIITAATILDWRVPFLVLCLALLGSIAPACLRREPCDSRLGAPPHCRRSILLDKAFLGPAMLMMLIQSSFTAVALAKPAILLETLRLTSFGLEATLSAFALLMLAGFHVSSRLTRSVSDHARIKLGMLLQCGAALLLIVSTAVPSTLTFVSACALAALAYCVLFPVLNALAMNMPESARVDASAWFGFLQGAGSGPIVLVGSMVDLPALARLASIVSICTLVALATANGLLRNTSDPSCTPAT